MEIGKEFQTDGAAVLKERLPKEVRLNGTCSSGADDDRNDRVLLQPFSVTTAFNGLFFRTTWVSRYRKGKTNLDLTETRDDGVSGCRGIG